MMSSSDTPLPSFVVAVIVTFFTSLTFFAVTVPLASTVAMVLSDVAHSTFLLLVASGNTVAISLSFFPAFAVFSPWIFISFARFATVISQVAFFPLPSTAVAVIFTFPFFNPVTNPLVSTNAIFLSELFQVTSGQGLSGEVSA